MTAASMESNRFQKWSKSIVALNSGARIKLIRTGVAADVLVSASEYFDMPRAKFVKFLGMSSATADRKIKNQNLLGPLASERLERLALIGNFAEKVFGNVDMARNWMLRENIVLGDTPLSMLDTGMGGDEVRKVLASIAYGGAV